MSADPVFENEREVLLAALELATAPYAPTPGQVLRIQLRDMCARNGLPRPNLDLGLAELKKLYGGEQVG